MGHSKEDYVHINSILQGGGGLKIAIITINVIAQAVICMISYDFFFSKRLG